MSSNTTVVLIPSPEEDHVEAIVSGESGAGLSSWLSMYIPCMQLQICFNDQDFEIQSVTHNVPRLQGDHKYMYSKIHVPKAWLEQILEVYERKQVVAKEAQAIGGQLEHLWPVPACSHEFHALNRQLQEAWQQEAELKSTERKNCLAIFAQLQTLAQKYNLDISSQQVLLRDY